MSKYDIAYILFGWILGMLGTIFGSLTIEKIRICKNKKKVTDGIIAELTDVQVVIAGMCFSITRNYGQFDIKFLEWWLPYYDIISADDNSPFNPNDKKIYKKIIELGNAGLQEYIAMHQKEKTISKLIPQIDTPYIDTNINFLSEYGEDYKREVLQIKRQLGILNDSFSQVQFYHKKSFDNVQSGINDIITANLDKLYNGISIRTKEIVDLIAKFILKNK